jgi:hypothetical protein
MYVIETVMPDGPHWYGGIRKQQKGEALVQGPEWSPYWEDRKEFNEQQAAVTFAAICKQMPGCRIVPVNESMRRDAWKFIQGRETPAWTMRAKYMTVGAVVQLPGRLGDWKVVDRDEKHFKLKLLRAGTGYADGNEPATIGVRSNQIVTVVGQSVRATS